jgi:PAS domain-containing protein
MLWLSLLGLATFLTIALRRVRRRQTPLNDELYAKNVAIDHVFSGVAWVRDDNRIAFVNPALSKLLQLPTDEIVRRDWRDLFALGERGRVEEAYSQMLLMGKATLDTATLGRHGEAQCNVLLVAVHDHKMRFVGHHCILQHTREHELKERLRELTAKSRELHLVS